MKQIITLFAVATMLCLQANSQTSFSSFSNFTLQSSANEAVAAPLVQPNNPLTYYSLTDSSYAVEEASSFKLLSFRASKTDNKKTTLEWSIDNNERLNYIEIEKRNKGKDFKTIAIVFMSEKEGNEKYKFKELTSSKAVYYRLKIVDDKDKGGYSEVISFKK